MRYMSCDVITRTQDQKYTFLLIATPFWILVLLTFVSNEPYILFLLQILWKSFNFQEVLIFGSCVTCLSKSKFMFLWRLWPWKNSHIPCGEWEFYNIGQNPSSNIFMKVPLCTSVASVFIELQNLFSSENDRTRLIFTRPRVVLTLNRNFKISALYMWKYVLSHNFRWGIRITFTFPLKSKDNIFKMASLSVKRSVLAYIYDVL